MFAEEMMPLTSKGSEIMSAMKKQYGEKKGEQVFYASKNAGRIAGVDMATADAEDKPKKKEEKLEPTGQLKAEEEELEKLEREHEQQGEERDIRNEIEDRKKSIRGLRDEIKKSAREALQGVEKSDALERLESTQNQACMVERVDKVLREALDRLDKVERRIKLHAQ
jgi:hypothetical protein